MTFVNPKEVMLPSGVAAKVLVVRPRGLAVDTSYRDPPSVYETRVAQILGEARLGQSLTPVPGPIEMLSEPELIEHPILGPVDAFSHRGKASLLAPGLTQAPLFLLRQHATDLDGGTLAANSNYFLFGKPDLDAIWNAYGDPIGLVLADCMVDFAPQLPRACLMTGKDGAAVPRIGFADIAIKLPDGEGVVAHGFGATTATGPYTAWARFFGSNDGCSPAGEGYDVAYIGRYPAAGRTAGAMPIPRAGCVVRFPDRTTALAALGPLDLRLEEPWHGGVQAGPAILRGGSLLDTVEDVFAVEHMTETDGLPEAGTVSPARWKADWDTTRAARLGAGVDDAGALIVVAVEGASSMLGDTSAARGATLRDLALLLKAEGAQDGLHLDGGGSTQVFGQAGGAVIAPSDVHHGQPERAAMYDRPIPTWIRLSV